VYVLRLLRLFYRCGSTKNQRLRQVILLFFEMTYRIGFDIVGYCLFLRIDKAKEKMVVAQP
jgi:hypothetical protein